AVISSVLPPSPMKILVLPRTRPTLDSNATASRPNRPAHTKKLIIARAPPSIRAHCMAILAPGKFNRGKPEEPRHVADPAQESRDADCRTRSAGPRQA